jgi:hypothetical protein
MICKTYIELPVECLYAFDDDANPVLQSVSVIRADKGIGVDILPSLSNLDNIILRVACKKDWKKKIKDEE